MSFDESFEDYLNSELDFAWSQDIWEENRIEEGFASPSESLLEEF